MILSMILFGYIALIIITYLIGKRDGWDDHCLSHAEQMEYIRKRYMENAYAERDERQKYSKFNEEECK